MFGYRRDAVDERDLLAAGADGLLGAFKLALPTQATVRDARAVSKDQLGSNSCVGQGVSQAQRLAYLKRGIECPELSALYVYRLARNEEGIHGDDGAQIRMAIKAVQELGCAPEAYWPFSMQQINTPLSFKTTHAARALFGLRGYYRITSGDLQSVRRALANGFPVVAGWDVTQAFCDWNGAEPIPAQRAPFVGGHAMVIVGYDGNTYELLNSWGPVWGRAGYATVTEEFVAQATDIWVNDIAEAA